LDAGDRNVFSDVFEKFGWGYIVRVESHGRKGVFPSRASSVIEEKNTW
jgi:hypothetical protein